MTALTCYTLSELSILSDVEKIKLCNWSTWPRYNQARNKLFFLCCFILCKIFSDVLLHQTSDQLVFIRKVRKKAWFFSRNCEIGNTKSEILRDPVQAVFSRQKCGPNSPPSHILIVTNFAWFYESKSPHDQYVTVDPREKTCIFVIIWSFWTSLTLTVFLL